MATDSELATDSERLAAYRKAGWVVAIHNDYRYHGEPHTFWLLTKRGSVSRRSGSYVCGEGQTEAQAFDLIDAVMKDRDRHNAAMRGKESSGGDRGD